MSKNEYLNKKTKRYEKENINKERIKKKKIILKIGKK